MASKRRLRKRSCSGKIRYPDKVDTVGHVLHLVQKNHVTDYHAYKCPFCKYWHVGRPPKRYGPCEGV